MTSTRTIVGAWAAVLGAVAALSLSAPAAADDAAKSKPASTTPTTAAAPTTQQHTMTMKEAKQKLGIIVFPAKGQSAQQQEAEEFECLKWGADQAGVTGSSMKDPKAAGQAAAAHVDTAATGAAVKGAAKGAAVGAIFGSISGNAGTGAAYGAAGGALAGRAAKKEAKANAAAQAEQKAAAENKAKLDAVKKGMTVCLESKGYTVK
jgi:hypothetical protein